MINPIKLPASSIILAATLLAVSPPAIAQPIDPIVNGQALVRLLPDAAIADFNATHGSTTLRSLPNRPVFLVDIPDGVDPSIFKDQAEADPNVAWCELNYYGQVPEARGRCFYGPPSPDAIPFYDQYAWANIGLEQAQLETVGSGTVIAVIDSGVDQAHEVFTALGTPFLTGWNVLEQNTDTADAPNGLDDDGDGEVDEMTGHGTHVTGLLTFVAPGAQILPIKVLDSDGNSDNYILAEGLFRAIDAGVDVISISAGSTYDSDAVRDAVIEAQNNGITVVASGGNVDQQLEEFPALNAGVIAVTSVDADDVKSWFASYHPNMTINGPGTQIYGPLPGNLYANWDGSSMTTPMVAATAALILSRHPDWPRDDSRPNNVRIALMQSAVNVDHQNPNYQGLLGAGRLHAAHALDSVDALAAAVSFGVGAAPQSLDVGDLNADGRHELVVANSAAASISVLRALPDGGYEPPLHYPAGQEPMAVALADFNADGLLDAAAANAGSGTVTIWFGNPDGSLTFAHTIPAGSEPRGIAAGQLIGDSLPDLVVADDDANNIRILHNQDGNFANHLTLPVGQRPYDVRLADLDHDQRLDLIAVNRESNTIAVVRRDAAGGFSQTQSYYVGNEPRAMAIGDLDGDSHIDVVAANHDGENIGLLWNQGNGLLTSPDFLTLEANRRPEYLAIADIDCDGVGDLLATSGDEQLATVSVVLSRGDRTFLQPVDYTVGADPQGIVAADIDNDGDPDLCVADRGADAVSVLINNGCGTEITPGDINCDGEVNAFDIDPFLLALTDPDAYDAAFPECSIEAADLNHDGAITNFDIDPFVALLVGG